VRLESLSDGEAVEVRTCPELEPEPED